MKTDENKDYNPADDDNQGVVQVLAQSEAGEPGVAQAEQLSPSAATKTEPEKAAGATDDAGINDDILAEEETESGQQTMKNE